MWWWMVVAVVDDDDGGGGGDLCFSLAAPPSSLFWPRTHPVSLCTVNL